VRCPFCYAHRFAQRLGKNPGAPDYYLLAQRGIDPFAPFFSRQALAGLDARLRRARKPRRTFVGSMGDLGGRWDYYVDSRGGLGSRRESRYAVIAATGDLCRKHPRHTFLILTKQPSGLAGTWPANAQIGVSVSTSEEARDRIPALLGRIEAGVRWVSVEPLFDGLFQCDLLEGVDWVVVGAQTGPGVQRPSEKIIGAARNIVEYCAENSIPCFVKQNVRKWGPGFEWPTEVVG
jgi:protein gp37